MISLLPGQEERRRTPRYKAADTPALLGWTHGDAFRTCPATLINISRDGALVVAHGWPPIEESVWLSVEGQVPTDWLEATVVGPMELREGLPRLRLSFREPCPLPFLETAIGEQPVSA